jgi:hypothetical protein
LKHDKPLRVDLEALAKAYKAFVPHVEKQFKAIRDFDAKTTQAESDKIFADAAEAFIPVQKAYIHATRYINSEDRWKLVSESMVYGMLEEAKLEFTPKMASSAVWDKIMGD